MSKIFMAGMDGSFANFGVAKLSLDLGTDQLDVVDLKLTETEKTKVKTVRKSSDVFRRAAEIYAGSQPILQDCQVCFAEIPFGGKNYDAVLGFGITIGVYAGVAYSIPLLEVSPIETKLATVGTKTASKQEMIEWAFETYPNAPWLTTKRGGELVPTLKNEHLADACAIVHAGIKTPAFKQVRAILGMSIAKAA
jgi:Holliday junction resolvasome RuvABC endonuclease subunit